jgi:1,2-diacylglycerol 3-alpha-glucosyltransferase
MKILMLTNTYRPFTGGVPRSVDTFAEQYRRMGHEVRIIAPTFEGQEEEPDVLRVPAIQNFNGTDFSVQLPIPFYLSEFMDAFQPDILHAHHPFLLGSTALRLGARYERPVVFTYHTLYERYTHYLPGGDSESVRRFVTHLAAGFANLCDQVIAPSTAVRGALTSRGVTTPIEVLPTGVDVRNILCGDGEGFRVAHHVPRDAFVVGFVSRLAHEKNLEFLCDAVLDFLQRRENAWFLVAGTGPLEEELDARFAASPVSARILRLGNLHGDELHGLYRALDVFAFASQTETQGLVVAEAMAARTPVVAVKASGVEDIVKDGVHGRLLETEDREAFVRALEEIHDMPAEKRKALGRKAREAAEAVSDRACAERALALYRATRRRAQAAHEHESAWDEFVNVIATEWNLLANLGHAAGEAISAAVENNEKEGEAARA